MKYRILRSSAFKEWFERETHKEQFQLQKRIAQIEHDGYFGEHKDLDEGLFELKWGGGRRVYYAIRDHLFVILLLGGNKNGQTHDIHEAHNILRHYDQWRQSEGEAARAAL